MVWYQALILMASGIFGAMVCVFLGGLLVFRTKTINMPGTNIVSIPKKTSNKPGNYLPEGFRSVLDDSVPSIFDEDLSPAAARLRDQKVKVVK